jgi:outer membrane protein assembly factor BamE (lipoprotein component of BamABCDE complex)
MKGKFIWQINVKNMVTTAGFVANLNPAEVDRVIVDGKTTKEQVRVKYGKPTSSAIYTTGEFWEYIYLNVSNNHSISATLRISFDTKGVALNHWYQRDQLNF